MVVIEILVNAEVLLVVDTVVNLDGELIAALGLHRHGHQRIAVGGSGNKLKQVNCRRVHAAQRNDIAREEVRIVAVIWNTWGCPQSGYATRTLIEREGAG